MASTNWENLPSTNTPLNATNLNKTLNKTGDTMTGDLNMGNNSVKLSTNGNIEWKEYGYGDKFRIIPDFNNTDFINKLIIQSTIGDAGTDPQNWKDLLKIHADTGRLSLPDGGFVPKFFQLGWGNSFTVATNWGGHGLIMVSNESLYMFWIAGNNHDQLSVNLIWGNDTCNITMPDSNHINVSRKDSYNMTCDVLFLTAY